MILDNEITVIGTTNFTSRSFHINDEMDFYVYGGPMIQQINQALTQDFQDSKEITSSFFANLSFLEKCKEKIAWLVNYYL